MIGRPPGATNRPQFHTYTNEIDRNEYVSWVKRHYQSDPQLAKWYGDQLFGKAAQVIAGDPENPLQLQITGMKIIKEDGA